MAKRTVCNLCGKTIDEWECDCSIHTVLGYGSKYDGLLLDLDLCSECADKLIDSLQDNCAVPMLSESHWEY